MSDLLIGVGALVIGLAIFVALSWRRRRPEGPISDRWLHEHGDDRGK